MATLTDCSSSFVVLLGLTHYISTQAGESSVLHVSASMIYMPVTVHATYNPHLQRSGI